MKIVFKNFSLFLTLLLLFAACSNKSGDEGKSEAPLSETLLLKDYNPQSIYRIPRTEVKRARYPIIDIHSHPYAQSEQDIERWLQIMDEAGIERTIILTCSYGEAFDSIAAIYSKYGDRFELWCGFDYTGYDQPGWAEKAVAELERCVRMGARGVGELGDKGLGMYYSNLFARRPGTKAKGMHLDDPRMDLLLKKCGEMGIPVNVHVADPIWMYQPMDSTNDGLMNAYTWRIKKEKGILLHDQLINMLENAVKRHPNTTFIACHFANLSYDLTRLGKMLDKYPNLWADNSARYAETATIPRFVRAFYQKYQDRLLYGTDNYFDPHMYRVTFRILETADEHFYEKNLFNYHWAYYGFDLPDAVLKKLYRQNALRLLQQRDEKLKRYLKKAEIVNN
ncbi:amidohydrolase family protein [Calditrichota bacterium LG25]